MPARTVRVVLPIAESVEPVETVNALVLRLRLLALLIAEVLLLQLSNHNSLISTL